LKILDPTYDHNKVLNKIGPGQYYDLPVPHDVKLTPNAKSKMTSASKEAKAKELAQKIAEFEAELIRLTVEQDRILKLQTKALHSKKKLAGMNEKIVKYFAYIEQNCDEFLKSAIAENKFLYRGQNDAKSLIFVGYPRDNREPKDSNLDAQKLMDKYLKLKGFKALRSNSIFTSSDYMQASNFGKVYAIFPKNGFTFTWSTKHDDIVLKSTDDVAGKIIDQAFYRECVTLVEEIDFYFMHNKDENIELSKDVTKTIQSVINSTGKKLDKAIFGWDDVYNLSKEIMKTRFVAIVDAYRKYISAVTILNGQTLDSDVEDNIRKVYLKCSEPEAVVRKDEKEIASDVIDNWGFKKTNLQEAMRSNHEICILGEYVAVNFTRFEQQLKQYFNIGYSSSKDDEDEEYTYD